MSSLLPMLILIQLALAAMMFWDKNKKGYLFCGYAAVMIIILYWE